jgi:hypothetical protein
MRYAITHNLNNPNPHNPELWAGVSPRPQSSAQRLRVSRLPILSSPVHPELCVSWARWNPLAVNPERYRGELGAILLVKLLSCADHLFSAHVAPFTFSF